MTEQEIKMNSLLGKDITGKPKEKYDAILKAYQELDIIETETKEIVQEQTTEENLEPKAVGITETIIDLNTKLKRRLDFINEHLHSITDPQFQLDIMNIEKEIEEVNKLKTEAINQIRGAHKDLDSIMLNVLDVMKKADEKQKEVNKPMEQEEIYARSSGINELSQYKEGLRNLYGDDYLNKMTPEEKNEYIYMYSKAYGIPEEEVSIENNNNNRVR